MKCQRQKKFKVMLERSGPNDQVGEGILGSGMSGSQKPGLGRAVPRR
jgi:hypothetical protein